MAAQRHVIRQPRETRLKFRLADAVEFGEEHRCRIARNEVQAARPLGLTARQVHQLLVEQLARAGLHLQHIGDGGAGSHDVVKVEHSHGSARGPRHEVERNRLEDGQRAFAARKELRQVDRVSPLRVADCGAEAASAIELGALIGHCQGGGEAVEVVPRGAPPVPGPLGDDGGCLRKRQCGQFPVDRPLQPAAPCVDGQIGGRHGTKVCSGAVGQQQVGGVYMVGHHAIEDRVAAGSVVGYGAAQRGAIGASGVGAKHEAERRERAVEPRHGDARLNRGRARLHINRQDAVEILAGVEHQRSTHRLPSERTARAARQQRHVVGGGHLERSVQVVTVAWNHHAHGLNLVKAGIRAVERAAPAVAAHLARNAAAQGGIEVAAFRSHSAHFGWRERGGGHGVRGVVGYAKGSCRTMVTVKSG